MKNKNSKDKELRNKKEIHAEDPSSCQCNYHPLLKFTSIYRNYFQTEELHYQLTDGKHLRFIAAQNREGDRPEEWKTLQLGQFQVLEGPIEGQLISFLIDYLKLKISDGTSFISIVESHLPSPYLTEQLNILIARRELEQRAYNEKMGRRQAELTKFHRAINGKIEMTDEIQAWWLNRY